MIANLSDPVAALKGKLTQHSPYYARMLNGHCIIQRKPNRKNHVPTEKETANRQFFGQKYGTDRAEATTRPPRDHTITAKAPPNPG